MPIFGIDKWIYPIEIPAGGAVIEFQEIAPGPVLTPRTSTVIPGGTYYCVIDTGSLPGGFQSLYTAIETAMSNAAPVTGATYTVALADPILSTGFVSNSTIALTVAGGGVIGFQIDFATTTLDPRVFGFAYNESGLRGSIGLTLTGDFTAYGFWQTPDLRTIEKTRRPVNLQFRSRGLEASTVVNRWSTRDYRRIKYQFVLGGFVRARRDEFVGYSDAAGLGQNDAGNYFEDLWSAGLSKYLGCFLVHDTGDGPGDLSGPYDLCRMYSPRGEDIDKCLQLQRMGGEYYQIQVETWIQSTTYRY